MSSLHGTIRRYQLIIHKLESSSYPTMREVHDFLHDRGFQDSLRTLQRDFEKIRYEFGVNIVYNLSGKGYFIDGESRLNVEQFLRFANLSHLTQLIAGSAAKDK